MYSHLHLNTHTHYIHITLTQTQTIHNTHHASPHTSHIIYISHSHKHKQYTTYITHSQTYIPHSHIHTWMNNDVHQQISVYWKRSSCIYTGHYVAAGNDQASSLLEKCITFYFNIAQFVFLDVCVFTYVHWVIDFQSLRSQTLVLSMQSLVLSTLLRQPLPVLIVFFVLSLCFTTSK